MKSTLIIVISMLLLASCVATAPSSSTTTLKNTAVLNITSLTAKQQLEKLDSGELTSYLIAQAYLQRIADIDQSGPRINSVLSVNPDALALAKQRDEERSNGKIKGKLHGIVFLVKDNIETAELPTTAGSFALANNLTNRDAPIIAKLKATGAIVLGKTNLSEWANFRSQDSISGWSGIAGQTRNPHSLDRTPCGSSSGSGAAIAALLAPLAIGTETNGSIICPAAINGIVGVKPTVGLLSRTHIVPISSTQDTAGPMTRSVYDAALMLEVMAGTDEKDKATVMADNNVQAYVNVLDKPVSGMRVGILRSQLSGLKPVQDSFEEATKVLAKLGVELVDIEKLDMPENFWTDAFDLLKYEFKHDLNAYLASTPDSVKHRTLEQLIAFNADSKRELVLFDQSIFEQSQAMPNLDDNYYEIKERLRKATQDDGIDRLLKEHNVDVLIAPSQVPAFLIDVIYGDSFPGGSAGAGWLAAIAGYPQVSVPMGDMRGLPINISFIGAKWDEARLLNIAYQYEQASQKIILPEIVKSAFEKQNTKSALLPAQE